MGRGNAVSADRGLHGIFFNPAGLHGDLQHEFLLTLSMPYARLGLRGISAAFMRRSGEYFLAAGLEAIGDPLYQQTRIAVGVTRDFGSFQLGLRPEWSLESAEGSRSWFSIAAGTQWEFSEKIRIGFAFSQLVRSGEYILSQSVVRAGFLWQAGDKLFLSGEYVTNDYKGSFALGIAYMPSSRIHFMGGLRIAPGRIYMGIRYTLDRCKVDYAIGSDPALGSQHALSIRWLRSSAE